MLDSERTVFPVLDADGQPACELSFDLVVASFQQGTTKVEFLEIEIEAAGGVQLELLESVAGALEGLMTLSPSTFTNLERAQALLLGAGG